MTTFDRADTRRPSTRCRRALATCLVAATAAAVAAQALPPSVRSALFDAPQLLRDLQVLSADDMQGRKVGTPGGARARAYLVARLKAIGVPPVGATYDAPFTAPAQGWSRPSQTGVNVVARIPGTRQPDRYIVISAHYDHVGVRNGQVFNGADDNASGTAAILAVAEYFMAHRPAHSLLVVAFDGEEAGLIGARAFVRQPPVSRASLALNINVDMVGRDPNNELFVVGTKRQPFLRPAVERVAATAAVHLRMGHEDRSSRADEDWMEDSDQYAFFEAGIPALYVGVSDEAFHHQPTDDFETITFDFYVRAVETVVGLVAEFDQGVPTP